VRAVTIDRLFELSVANGGARIPADVMAHLFRPVLSRQVRLSLQGPCLGVYTSSEIAKAHGGTPEVTSTGIEARFTFRMLF
jgi:nitrogen-specific signal transduction histidine kinase